MSKCSLRVSTIPAGSVCGMGSRPRPGASPGRRQQGAWGSTQCVGVHSGCCVGRVSDLQQTSSRSVG